MKILKALICSVLLVAGLNSCEKINLNRLEGTWAEQFDEPMNGSLEFTFDGNGNFQLHTYDALSGKSTNYSGSYLLDAEYISENNTITLCMFDVVTTYKIVKLTSNKMAWQNSATVASNPGDYRCFVRVK